MERPGRGRTPPEGSPGPGRGTLRQLEGQGSTRGLPSLLPASPSPHPRDSPCAGDAAPGPGATPRIPRGIRAPRAPLLTRGRDEDGEAEGEAQASSELHPAAGPGTRRGRVTSGRGQGGGARPSGTHSEGLRWATPAGPAWEVAGAGMGAGYSRAPLGVGLEGTGGGCPAPAPAPGTPPQPPGTPHPRHRDTSAGQEPRAAGAALARSDRRAQQGTSRSPGLGDSKGRAEADHSRSVRKSREVEGHKPGVKAARISDAWHGSAGAFPSSSPGESARSSSPGASWHLSHAEPRRQMPSGFEAGGFVSRR